MEKEKIEKEKESAIFWGILAAFVLAGGIIWLGNDLGWWQIALPFWPIAVIFVGLVILISAIRKFKII